MHSRQRASLGTQAAQEQWGVDTFDEKHRDTHSFAKRVGRLPEQQENDDVDYRGLLHRDGSVISAVTLQVGCPTYPPPHPQGSCSMNESMHELMSGPCLYFSLSCEKLWCMCRIWRPQSRCTGSWGPRWWWGCPSRTRPPVTPCTCPKYRSPQTKLGEEP